MNQDSPWFLNDLLEDLGGIVVAHVLEANIVDLQNHVPRLDSPVQGNCSS